MKIELFIRESDNKVVGFEFLPESPAETAIELPALKATLRKSGFITLSMPDSSVRVAVNP